MTTPKRRSSGAKTRVKKTSVSKTSVSRSKSTSTKTRKARAKPATSKAAPKKRAARSRSPKKSPASKAPKRRAKRTKSSEKGGWLRFLFVEASVVVTAAAVGALGGFAMVYSEAVDEVAAHLASPVVEQPSTIWSAPMSLKEGQRVSRNDFVSDLIAAGYDRSEEPVQKPCKGVGAFFVSKKGVSVQTCAQTTPALEQSTVEYGLKGGVVTSVSSPKVLLHPTVLAHFGDLEKRRSPHEGTVPKPIENALLSMEDVRFRQHYGFDPVGILRAGLQNLSGGQVQGASTLTQQIAKNTFLSPERTLRRKLREVVYALALEASLTKDELLSLYVNEVYLGQMNGQPLHGVDAAARAWFGVSASKLTAAQASTIVGVIPSPNAYSPIRHPEKSLQRRNLVLKQQRRFDLLDDSELEHALSVPLTLKGVSPSRVRRAPYAVDRIVAEADHVVGNGVLARGGTHVWTTIDPILQRAAEESLKAGLSVLEEHYEEAKGAQAALAVVDGETGGIIALVGGRSYVDSPFDRASYGWRQAGSTVKPLTMLAAFEAGTHTPASSIPDRPITRLIDGKPWTPSNYDGRFRGEVTLHYAMTHSTNIPAIHLAEAVGASALQHHFRDAGLSRATNLPSAALGGFEATPLELASSYTAFVAGKAFTPQLIIAITGPGGDAWIRVDPTFERLASKQSAAMARSVLQDVLTQGTGRGAAKFGVGPPAAGKTGTTNDFRDAWFVGISDGAATAVWVGKDEGTLGLSGGRAALPIWARFVAASGQADPPEKIEGLTSFKLCVETGLLAQKDCPETYTDLFQSAKPPTKACNLHGAPVVKAR